MKANMIKSSGMAALSRRSFLKNTAGTVGAVFFFTGGVKG